VEATGTEVGAGRKCYHHIPTVHDDVAHLALVVRFGILPLRREQVTADGLMALANELVPHPA